MSDRLSHIHSDCATQTERMLILCEPSIVVIDNAVDLNSSSFPDELSSGCFLLFEGSILFIRSGVAEAFPLPEVLMNSASHNSVSTHANGQMYRPTAGRAADRDAIEDHRSNNRSVIKGTPSPDEFLTIIRRELRIRFYQQNTIKSDMQALTGFLSWYGRLPHRVKPEDLREYLEVMVDGGASSSHVGVTLSAIRTAFDKMCLRQVTLGLVIPRKPKRLPVVLNMAEVRLIDD